MAENHSPLVAHGHLDDSAGLPVYLSSSALRQHDILPRITSWLASQDYWDKAGIVLADVRHLPADHPYIQQELLELRTQLDHDKEVMQGAGFWELQKECWTIPANRKRALLTVGMVTFQQWTGVSVGTLNVSCLKLTFVKTGAINYYAPTIFKGFGLSSTTTGLFAQGIYGVVKVVTCPVFVFFLADSLGHRLSLMWSGAVQGFAMFLVGLVSP